MNPGATTSPVARIVVRAFRLFSLMATYLQPVCEEGCRTRKDRVSVKFERRCAPGAHLLGSIFLDQPRGYFDPPFQDAQEGSKQFAACTG